MSPTLCVPTGPSPFQSNVKQREETDLQGALGALAKFASLDTAQYASLLVSIERKAKEAQSSNPQHEENRKLLAQLEAVRRDEIFGETHIPELVQAIHRFHSNLAHWHHEDSRHLQEIRQLQEQLAASKLRERRITKEFKNLSKQNIKLRNKLQEKRNVLAQARTWFRESLAERESLQEIATVAQMQVHEHLMAAPGRIRLGSADSNFSDVDALDYLAADNTTTDSVEESESQSSLVTDEGVATLRFAMDESPPRIASTSSAYTLEFLSGVKTGLRIKSVPASEWIPSAKPALSPMHLDGTESTFDETESCHNLDEESVVFVVCGHHQVDSDDKTTGKFPRIALPPVGARVIAIREQKITSTWTMSALLAAMSSTADQRPVFKVTFQNGRMLKAKNSKASSDDESIGEKQTSENPPEPSRNHRSFNLLPFGKGQSSKPKNSENQVDKATEQEPNKAPSNTGNGNPLKFWRNDEKGNDSKDGHLEDLSFEKTTTVDSNDPVKQTKQSDSDIAESIQGAPLKTESSKSEVTNKGHANPLMFWKKEEGGNRPRKNTSDSIGLRPRRNTADSCGITEGTAMSKEDVSIASSTDTKAEESHAAKECDQISTKAHHKGLPMNNLMFWRKTEQTPEPESVQILGEKSIVDQEKPERPESVNAVKATDKPQFRLDFWNASAQQEVQFACQNGTLPPSSDSNAELHVVDELPKEHSGDRQTDSCASVKPGNDSSTPIEVPEETNVVTIHPACETSRCIPAADEAPKPIDNTVSDSSCSPEESKVEAVPSAAPEADPSNQNPSDSVDIDTELAADNFSTPTEIKGPLNQMSRFFSNPFAG